jgi:Zn-dependent metalloprotease
MKTKKIILTVCLIGYSVILTAQLDRQFWNQQMLEIADKGEYMGWVDIKDEYRFTKNDFFSKNKAAFLFTSKDEMQHLSSTEKDELGYTRHLFQQMHKGIQVEGAQYKLHEKDERIFCANGHFVTDIAVNTEPALSEEQALKQALACIGASVYAWQTEYPVLNEDGEKSMYPSEKPDAYKYPQGALVLTRLSYDLPLDAENLVLAYKFEITAVEPYSSTLIYVNAQTGEIVREHSLDRHNVYEGQALTRYNGWQTIITSKRLGKYVLEDWAHGNGIGTYDGITANPNYQPPYYRYKDADNNWSLPSEQPATSVHWAMGYTYDYFYAIHGRNGYNNAGASIISYITTGNNSYWRPALYCFLFGTGDGGATSNPVASLDAVAHEFTHAVIGSTGNLLDYGEPSALNESFCDIFASLVEFYHLGSNGNYYLGENIITIPPYMERNMTNPNNTSQPDTYHGNYWYYSNNSAAEQNKYMHNNNGVHNYWFYLLAEGGSGINDNGFSYNVQGIGRAKAERIVYRSLVNGYLTAYSQYMDAAISSLRVAMELYSDCSYEVTQVYKAWQAVGININLTAIPGYNKTVSCAAVNAATSPVKYTALNDITANCAITTSQSVVLRAGNVIRLSPGFKVSAGSKFYAYITPCDQVNAGTYSSSHKSINYMEETQIDGEETDLLSEKNGEAVTIYPNPNNGSFTIGSNEAIQQIEVYNLLGQVVYKADNPDDKTIQLPADTKGVFFVRITTQTECVTKKILVQ